MADVEFEKGEGAEQLPQGEATQANELTVVAPDPIDADIGPLAETAAETVSPDLASPEDYEPQYEPGDEDGAFLTGPTTRPGEHVSAGATAAPQRMKLTPDLLRALPDIVAASQKPGASQQLRTLAAFLVREATA